VENVVILDANAILRYILDDIPEQADQVEETIKTSTIKVLPEVIAEVIYVMTKSYSISYAETSEYVYSFLDDVKCKNDLLVNAVKLFGTANIDFVDCLLHEYSKQPDCKIFTFDKKLLNLIKNTSSAQ
jgi:predicted nucleic-acid-binding protein